MPGPADRYLMEEAAAAERLAGRTRLALVAGLCLLQLALAVTGAEQPSAMLATGAVLGCTIVYSALVLMAGRGVYRPWFSYLTTTLDVMAVTSGMLAVGLASGDVAGATKSPFSMLYFLAIAIAGTRQMPRLPIYAGFVSTLGFLSSFAVLLLWRPSLVDISIAHDFGGPTVSPIRIGTIAALIFLSGFLTATTARRARLLVRRALKERATAVREQERRQQALRSFERYLPEKRAIDAIADGKELDIRGERRNVTVLIRDIRGFTTFSERLPPDAVVEILNTYFTAMVEVLFRHDGVLISFIGDGMVAVFGLPEERPDDPQRALAAALEMRARLDAMNAQGLFAAVGEVAAGTAIHSGEVVVGTIGSPRRLDYTVIGDAVNIAARLEETNKFFDSDLVISEVTADRIGFINGLVDRGEVDIRGRRKKLRVYTLGASALRAQTAQPSEGHER